MWQWVSEAVPNINTVRKCLTMKVSFPWCTCHYFFQKSSNSTKPIFIVPLYWFLKSPVFPLTKFCMGLTNRRRRSLNLHSFLLWMQPDSPCRLSSTLLLSLSSLDTWGAPFQHTQVWSCIWLRISFSLFIFYLFLLNRFLGWK